MPLPEPMFWLLFGSGATIVLERLFRWLWRQEHDEPYLLRERALKAYREKHPA